MVDSLYQINLYKIKIENNFTKKKVLDVSLSADIYCFHNDENCQWLATFSKSILCSYGHH